MKRNRVTAAVVTVLLSVMCMEAAVALEGAKSPYEGYLEFETLSAWRRLAPELVRAEVCNLTSAGHALWEEGQLRLPDPSLGGDFNADGLEDRAVRLRSGPDGGPCAYVLLVTMRQKTWTLLQLERVGLDEYAGGDVLWMAHQQAIGIDSGQKERLTRPATMWSDGEDGGGSAGYAIDVTLVYHTLKWHPTLGRFEYERLDTPHKVADPEERELLIQDGHLP